jgi:hypothetical protein
MRDQVRVVRTTSHWLQLALDPFWGKVVRHAELPEIGSGSRDEARPIAQGVHKRVVPRRAANCLKVSRSSAFPCCH